MRILFLSITVPYPATDGGRIRVLNLLKQLATLNRVTFVALETKSTDREGMAYLQNLGIETHLVPHGPHLPPLTLRTGLRALVKRQPITVARYDLPVFRQKFHALLENNTFDLIHYEMFHTAQYRTDTEVPSLLSQQNVDSYIWRRLCERTANPVRKFMFWTQTRAFEHYERVMSPKFDGVACTSEIDRALLGQVCPNLITEVIPNGVDIESYHPNHEREEPATVIYTGSMDWYPNEDAAIYFTDEILPRIYAKYPDVKFYIVGQDPTDRLQKLGTRSKIIVTGRVEEVKPYIAQATVFVVPLRIGSGTRLKILEALAMEKAVVSTQVGAEGLGLIDGEEIIIADEPQRFADGVCQLIGDQTVRRRLGTTGRQRVEADYDWRRIGKKLHEFYEQVVHQKNELFFRQGKALF